MSPNVFLTDLTAKEHCFNYILRKEKPPRIAYTKRQETQKPHIGFSSTIFFLLDLQKITPPVLKVDLCSKERT